MSGTETSNTASWKAWEGSVVEGKFPLKQWLGASDHSAVFLTEHANHKAAIKVVAADVADPDQLSRWQNAAKLSHPHLIRIFASGHSQHEGVSILYVAMESADDDLAQLLPERALAPEEASDLLPPVLDALSYIHSKGLVHGRIQPSNVLAVGDQLKLSSDQIVSPAAVNTNHRRRDLYDAPETAAGIVSPAGDLWSVGVTLVAALTQNVAFVGEAEHGGPKLPATIPEPFRGIARECLHLDPRRRCSIAEIKARLQPAARSVPAPAEIPARQASRTSGEINWRMLIPILVLVVLAFGWGLFHRSASPSAKGPDSSVSASEPPKAATPATSPVPSPSVPSPSVSSPSTTAASGASPSSAPATVPAPPNKSNNVPGEVLHQLLPEVPQSARNTISGTIKVGIRVRVDASGKVTDAELEHAGPSRYFARLALQAAEKWEFTAPQVDGQPTTSTWLIHFRFRRTSTQASPEPLRHGSS